MKNKEKYAAELAVIEKSGKIAISGGKPEECCKIMCGTCERAERIGIGTYQCSDLKLLEWAESEYEEPPVDWSKVPVDTKILVRNCNDRKWWKRHFAKFEDGIVYAFSDGKTSWSSGKNLTKWEQAKLAEE